MGKDIMSYYNPDEGQKGIVNFSGGGAGQNAKVTINYHIHIHSNNSNFIHKIGRVLDGIIRRKTTVIENASQLSGNDIQGVINKRLEY